MAGARKGKPAAGGRTASKAASRSTAKAAGKNTVKAATGKPAEKRATRTGTCPTCCKPIHRGAPIAPYGGVWVHAGCAAFEANRSAVLSGNTFAAQKPSDWRRGASPSSRPRPPARLPGRATPEPTYQGPIVPISRVDPDRKTAVGRAPSALPQLGKTVRVDNGRAVLARPSGGPPVPTRRQSKQVDVQAATVTDDQALGVPCVSCRALAGQPCRSANGKPIAKAHFARRQHVARTATRPDLRTRAHRGQRNR